MRATAKEYAMTHMVYFNDYDISAICVSADDESGTAEVLINFAGDLDGGVASVLIDENGEPITVKIHGNVRIEKIK